MTLSTLILYAIAIIELLEGAADDYKHSLSGATGRYQIRQCVIDDVNRRHRTSYVLADAHDPAKAKAIAAMWLSMWAPPDADIRVLAAMWRFGPSRGKLRTQWDYPTRAFNLFEAMQANNAQP